MNLQKHYFHDRNVLILLGVNALLTIFGMLAVFLRLDPNSSATHIVQYRSNLGIESLKSGSINELRLFLLFMVVMMVGSAVLSIRIYSHRRAFAVTLLGLTTMVLVVTIVVSNALLLVNS